MADLADRVQSGLARQLGTEAWEELRQVDSLEALEDGRRATLEQALGHVLLNEMYRGLIQAVGDRQWIDYLTQMEGLRTAIGLEAYGQRDPLVQYKSRAFDMFQQLMADIRAGVASRLFRAQVPAQPAPPSKESEAEAPLALAVADEHEAAEPAESAPRKRRRRH